MQEVREEMTRRIASLERRNEYLATQRAEVQSEIAGVETEMQTNSTLAKQYQQVLDSIPKPV